MMGAMYMTGRLNGHLGRMKGAISSYNTVWKIEQNGGKSSLKRPMNKICRKSYKSLIRQWGT